MNRERAPQLSKREQTLLEVDVAQRTWQEALERLPQKELSELTGLTNNLDQSEEEIQSFLREHETRLSPEGKFFLQMTINLRRVKNRLNEVKE